MRVTKVIRDYVEREVSLKFEPAFNEAEKMGNPAVQEIRDAIHILIDELNAKAIAMATEAGVFSNKVYGRPCDEISLVTTGHHFGQCIRDETMDEARGTRLRELRKQKEKVIEDILLSLELGEATKDQLRSLIDNVTV